MDINSEKLYYHLNKSKLDDALEKGEIPFEDAIQVKVEDSPFSISLQIQIELKEYSMVARAMRRLKPDKPIVDLLNLGITVGLFIMFNLEFMYIII